MVRAWLALYAALVTAPVLLAWWGEPSGGRVLGDSSSALAMSAYVMILAEFVLSGRFRFLSDAAGIDRVMRFHQLAGRVAAGILFFHPFLYAAERLGAGAGAALGRLHRLFAAPAYFSGVLAWVLLLLLVLVAIGRDRLRVPYEAWRLGHGLSALAVGILGLHHVLTVGAYSQAPLLAAFWFALTGIAVLAFASVYIARPLRLLRSPWRVVSIRCVAERQWEMTLENRSPRGFRFRAGQFVWLTIGMPLVVNDHPFSVVTPPAELPKVSLLIKETGDFTKSLSTIALDARAYVDGPYGAFTLDARNEAEIVFIAGGVGIAPILSLLREAEAGHDRRPMRLVYGNRSARQIAYRDDIDVLAQRLRMRVDYVLSEPPAESLPHVRGQLDGATLAAVLGSKPSPRALYLLCGPPPMMEEAETFLIRAGVPRRAIVSERFRYD